MGILLIIAAAFTIAYQIDKPCDHECFRNKIQTENKNNKRHKDDWRYPNRGGFNGDR
jgi:hypothetical protein